MLAFVDFETPVYLWLLLLIPLVMLWSRRSLAGIGRGRQIAAIGLRSVVILVAVLALSGLRRVTPTEDMTVTFVVDRSNSVPAEFQDRAFEFIKAAAEAKGRDPSKRLAIVSFDGRARVEQLPNTEVLVARLGEPLAEDQTDIAGAVRMALALVTDDSARRIVVLTDGNENVGEIRDELGQLRAQGIPIDVIPIEYEYEREVVFEQLRVPPTSRVRDRPVVQLLMRSTLPTTTRGRVRLFQNEQMIREELVTLDPGPNRFDMTGLEIDAPGPQLFRAEYVPLGEGSDTLATNNVARGVSFASGQGNVLLVTTEANRASTERIATALRREGLADDNPMGVEVVLAGTPLSLVELQRRSVVILDNVPSYLIEQQQQESLSTWVREFGGGLVMVGGDEGFGAGGWLGSPVEEIMPVRFDVKSQKQIPQGALMLIMHACEIPEGNFIGERVAIDAVKALSSRDIIGVLAYDWSGDGSDWVVEPQEVGDKRTVIQKIRGIVQGDMPDMTPIVAQAVDGLVEDAAGASRKHIVIISDFDPLFDIGPGGFGSDLLDEMREANISCSTITVGWGGHPIDAHKAAAIAQRAAPGGSYYPTKDFSKLPQIFIKEASIVRRSLIAESRSGFVVSTTPNAFSALAGLLRGGVPPVFGYVVTTAKPTAQIPLLIDGGDDQQDPILAHWQVGLGRTVAFTSGMWDRWGPDWPQQERFSKIWAQLVRWTARAATSEGYDIAKHVEGGQVRLRVDTLGDDTATRGTTQLEGRVYAPDGSSGPLTLLRTGPGRFEGRFKARDVGTYVFQLAGGGTEGQQVTLSGGVSVAYSPEYRELAANRALLDTLWQQSGGRALDFNAAAAPFDRAGLPLATQRRVLWEDLIRLLLLLFILDVAVRRIAITPADVLNSVRRFARGLSGRRETAEESAAVLGTLRGAQARAREQREVSETGRPPRRSTEFGAPQTSEQSTEALSKALGGTSEEDQPVVAQPSRKPRAESQGSYTSRLLAAKRRAQEQQREAQDDSPEAS